MKWIFELKKWQTAIYLIFVFLCALCSKIKQLILKGKKKMKLKRSKRKMFLGVIATLTEMLGIESLGLMRAVAFLAILLTGVFPGLFIYLIAGIFLSIIAKD